MAAQNVSRRRPPRFDLSGGHLALDFVNTLDDRPSAQTKEQLTSYIDLARFAEDTGILTAAQVDHVFARSEATPAEARKVLRSAIQLREAMYEVFVAANKKTPMPALALATVNEYAQQAAQHYRLVPAKRGFEWRFDEISSFNAMLWPIARAAAELLASDQLKFIHACSSKTCEWLFLDTSKSHRRRWCSMKSCGNRAKARKYYARSKK